MDPKTLFAQNLARSYKQQGQITHTRGPAMTKQQAIDLANVLWSVSTIKPVVAHDQCQPNEPQWEITDIMDTQHTLDCTGKPLCHKQCAAWAGHD